MARAWRTFSLSNGLCVLFMRGKDIQPGAWKQLEAGISLDLGKVIRAGIIDDVCGAGLQFQQAGCGFTVPAEDELLIFGSGSP